MKKQRVQEQGIYLPLERLVYLTEGEFKFLTVLINDGTIVAQMTTILVCNNKYSQKNYDKANL